MCSFGNKKVGRFGRGRFGSGGVFDMFSNLYSIAIWGALGSYKTHSCIYSETLCTKSREPSQGSERSCIDLCVLRQGFVFYYINPAWLSRGINVVSVSIIFLEYMSKRPHYQNEPYKNAPTFYQNAPTIFSE